MPTRRVWECTSFDTSTATCAQAVWVERSDFPELAVADAMLLLGSVAVLFAVAWGWKFLSRQTRA